MSGNSLKRKSMSHKGLCGASQAREKSKNMSNLAKIARFMGFTDARSGVT
jgi:hypothetical protein